MNLCPNLTWMSVQGLVQDFVVVSLSLLVSSVSLCSSAGPLSNICACLPCVSPFVPSISVFLQIFRLESAYLVTCIIIAFLLLTTSSKTEMIQLP